MIVLLFTAVICFGAYIHFQGRLKDTDDNVVQVSAMVADTIKYQGYSSRGVIRTYYKPVYVFQLDGERHRVVSDIGYNPCPYEVGQEVLVAFDTCDPNRVKVTENRVAKLLSVMFYVFGILCLLGIMGIGAASIHKVLSSIRSAGVLAT